MTEALDRALAAFSADLDRQDAIFLARWKHPQGYTLTGKDIAPSRDYKKPWPDDLKMDIGKAFFLDDEGHGPWDGEIDL